MSELIIRIPEENADLIRTLSNKYDVSCNKIANAIIEQTIKDAKVENIKIKKYELKITIDVT